VTAIASVFRILFRSEALILVHPQPVFLGSPSRLPRSERKPMQQQAGFTGMRSSVRLQANVPGSSQVPGAAGEANDVVDTLAAADEYPVAG
jgi:hypothetical protein